VIRVVVSGTAPIVTDIWRAVRVTGWIVSPIQCIVSVTGPRVSDIGRNESATKVKWEANPVNYWRHRADCEADPVI